MQVAFYTLGCKVNQYESQILAQLFADQGYNIIPFGPGGDVYVVNSCTVTAEGDRKTRQLLRRLRRENPESILVLTGCFPQAFPQEAQELSEVDVVTGSSNRRNILTALNKYLVTRKKVVDIMPYSQEEVFEAMTLGKAYHRTRAFVKIEDGCDRYCTYCIIPTARGSVRSKPLHQLQEEVIMLAEAGHLEVVLTGINLSSYGKDLQLNLVDAVEVVAGVPGIQRIRLGSLEPDVLTTTDLDRMVATGKVCSQFHLSLQSGSDTVLGRMARRYKMKDYLRVVNDIRCRFKNPAFTTDLMIGFPGETENEFIESLELVQKIGFSKIHGFTYSPRVGTRAAQMSGQISPEIKEERMERLLTIARELRYQFFQKMVGSLEEVLVEERGKDGFQIGYTSNYTPVVIPNSVELEGRLVTVRITGVQEDGCLGIIEEMMR